MSATSDPTSSSVSGRVLGPAGAALAAAGGEPSSADVLRRAAGETWEPRVLVVDDDPVSCVAHQRLLEQLGLVVEVAGDGPEAIEMARAWPYVAIFMDCSMPDIDGFRATREIRTLEGLAQAPIVIAVTSRPRHVCLASGMDHHILKPLRLEELAADCLRLGLTRRPDLVAEAAPADDRADDAPALTARAGVSERRTAELAASFVRRGLLHLPRLWRAVNSGDTAAVHRTARDLGQHAASVGAAHLAAVCEELSEAARRGQIDNVVRLEPQVRTALARTAAAARDELHPGPTALGQPIVPAPGPFPEVSETAPEHVSEAAAEAAPDPSRPIRVVVADDDPLARLAIEAMIGRGDGLELAGSAADVDEIVALVGEQRPDVAVLDYMMPGGGGTEAARRIRRISADTQVIALTATDRPEAYLAMLRAGAAGLLVKGSPADRLVAMIHRAVEQPAA